ncbi:MAG: hypothetical protein AAGC46_17570 [Solirubrobacteraceae bacterium]|nr:hypothetical protein [Patulibacter sp.]
MRGFTAVLVWFGTGLALATGVGAAPARAAAGHATASTCVAGTPLYRAAALTLVKRAGHHPRLTACVGRHPHRVTVALPPGTTTVQAATKSGAVVAVLLRVTGASGLGASVLELDARGRPVGPAITIPASTFTGKTITGFGVLPGTPYAALSTSSDEFHTYAVAADGTTSPIGFARAYGKPDGAAIHLEPASQTIRWTHRHDRHTLQLLGQVGCTVPGAELAETALVRVYRIGSGFQEADYACERATGHITLLGTPAGLGSNAIGDSFNPATMTVAGTFVAYHQSFGYDPDVDVEYEMVADLAAATVRTAWMTSPTDGSTEHGSPVLTEHGTLVTATYVIDDSSIGDIHPCPALATTPDGKKHGYWTVVATPATGPRTTLDCVADDVASAQGAPYDAVISGLHLDGGTVSWIAGMTPKSAPIT